MTYYGAKDLADSFRTVRKNTILVAEEIPEDRYGFQRAGHAHGSADVISCRGSAEVAATDPCRRAPHHARRVRLPVGNAAVDRRGADSAQQGAAHCVAA